jgi:hypothetical protein
MGPSQRQLRLLSPEDRAIYKQWLRRSMVFYGTVVTLLVAAAAANHFFASPSSDVAGDTVHTAAITTKK